MENVSIDDMNNQYLDVLQEIGNIGTGNAMTALSQMLKTKIDMKVPSVKLMDFKDVGTRMGGEEQIVAGVYLLVEGDISGSIMFMQTKKSAKNMIEKLMGIKVEKDAFNDIEQSALKEIGNIITGAYLNALSLLTNLTVFPSIPDLCIDMAGALLSVPATEFGISGDKLLLIKTDFSDDKDMSGYFIMVPDEESFVKIINSLGL